MQKPFLRFALRLPRELHEWLVAGATREHRSLHAHIIHLLTTLREDEKNG